MMDNRDRATSRMKQKEEIDMKNMKNRGTIKIKPFEEVKNEEQDNSLEEKKTLVKDNKPRKLSINEIDEREYSNYEDPSLRDSPKSLRSGMSINEKKHLDFNIKTMINLIESCCTNPLKQVEYIVELFKGVDYVLNHDTQWSQIFYCDTKDPRSVKRLTNDMDYFLHNSLILIENQEELRTPLLSILANMAVIDHPQQETFGFKCLKALKELINNDNYSVKNLVINTLKTVVVPFIKKKNFMKISYNILHGVNVILTNSFNKEGTLFEPDLMAYGAEWINQINSRLSVIKETKAPENMEALKNYLQSENEFLYHEEIMSFLSNLTLKKTFAESLSELIKIESLTSLFESYSAFYSTWKKIEDKRKPNFKPILYLRMICVLELITNISPFLPIQGDPKNSPLSKFLSELERNHIEAILKDFVITSETLYDKMSIINTERQSMEEYQLYYKNLATCIITYANLLRFVDITILTFREETVYKPTPCQVVNLINYSKINPEILKACSIFIISLLKHPSLEFASDFKIHNLICNLVMDFLPLLYCIDGETYSQLCIMGKLYEGVQKVILDEKDKRVEYDYEEIPYCEQRNLEIQEALFYVIRVIKILSNFKTQNSKLNKTQQFCIDFCQKHDFIKLRNHTLFLAFEIPSDNVKLMICRTFSCLNPVVWTLDDIKNFVEILKNWKSFSKKNSDEIIAEIFLIFSKILLSYNANMEQIMSEIIDLCFEILLNNMERNFKDFSELNSRKIQIAVSCIYFLKIASTVADLQNYFQTPKILFLTKKFFYYEEKYMNETMTPLLLEDTWACSNIEHLLQSTAGNEQIQANSLLGFRVISRIADILEDKILIEMDEDSDILQKEFTDDEEKMEEESEEFHHWFQPKCSVLVNRIKQFFEKNFINKVKNELSTWNKISKTAFFNKVTKALENTKKEEYVKSKNKELFEENLSFNGQQIVYRMAMFVLMKEKNFQNKNDICNKTSLSQKIDDFIKNIQRNQLAKEKPNLYKQMNLKDPSTFDSKKLRGKELLEIEFQGLKTPTENEFLAIYRQQFFDVNNTLFLDYSKENFIKNKTESPLKKKVGFELNDSFNDSLDKSHISHLSHMKETQVSTKFNPDSMMYVENSSILNKKGVEQLLENLNNKPYEDIINDNFSTRNPVNLNRNAILLSALFRAMYFANKKSVISEKETIKSQKNSINVLRGLTKLAKDISWVNSNIGFKYLRAVKFYYTMPQGIAYQDEEMLHIYEIIFKSVNGMLKDIKNNCLDVSEKELLKLEVMYLISEISHCLKALLEQITTIAWGKNNLIEKEINKKEEKKHKKEREKTLQEKCVEFVVNQLFPMKYLKIVIKILLIYYKIFSDSSLNDQFESRAVKLHDKITHHFQLVIAAYLAICEDKKYDILDIFSQYEYLSNQPMRQTFISEIVKENDRSLLSLGIERYIYREVLGFSKEKERILICFPCYFRKLKDLSDQEMLLVLTNRGLYVMKMQLSSCTVCPQYEFCTDGPVIIVKHPYQEIMNFMTLEGDQRFGLRVNRNSEEIIYFFQLQKPFWKKMVEAVLEKNLNIVWIKDTLYEDTISTFSISNKIIIWLLVSMDSNPTMILHKNLNFQRKMLILTYTNDILIVKEYPKEYIFIMPKVIGSSNAQKIFSTSKKPATSKKKIANKILLEVERRFDTNNSLKKLVFENSDENMIYMKFNDNQILSLKFDCDYTREKFKQEITIDLSSQQWRKVMKSSSSVKIIRNMMHTGGINSDSKNNETRNVNTSGLSAVNSALSRTNANNNMKNSNNSLKILKNN